MDTARGIYRAECAWNAYPVGLFTLGLSTISGPDTFAASQFSETFGGPHDDLTGQLIGARWTRGHDTKLENLVASTCTVDLRDPAGIYNPDNTTSPLYGLLESRLHPFRLRGVSWLPALAPAEDLAPSDDLAPADGEMDELQPLFFGYVTDIVWEPQGRKGSAQLQCVDVLYWLDQIKPVIAATGPTTVGAAIGLILNAAGFVDPAARVLATGESIPDFSADGTKTGTELVQDLLVVERGLVYADAAGRVVFESRNARELRTVAATIVDLMTEQKPSVQFGGVYNRVTVTRTQTSYVAVAEDATSQRAVGTRDYPTIETAYLNLNADADSLAAYVLDQVVTPKPPTRDLTIDNRTIALLNQIISRELIDRIFVTNARAGTGGEYHIERVEHELKAYPYRHTAKYLLSRGRAGQPLLIGTGAISSDYLAA